MAAVYRTLPVGNARFLFITCSNVKCYDNFNKRTRAECRFRKSHDYGQFSVFLKTHITKAETYVLDTTENVDGRSAFDNLNRRTPDKRLHPRVSASVS